MANGHFSTAGAYRVDPKTEFYRAEQERVRVEQRVTRAEFWLGQRMAGQGFASEDQMRFAVVALAETLGYPMDDETSHVLRTAVASLWETGRYRLANAA